MSDTICGADCTKCEKKESCGGCLATGGRPFQGDCVIASCCKAKGHDRCGKCPDAPCRLRERLIEEFNALGIPDLPKVTGLNALIGSYINLTYPFPGGQAVRFLDDKKIYLANQLEKKDSDRCYGLAADETFLLVCEYGCNGTDAEIVAYRRRK